MPFLRAVPLASLNKGASQGNSCWVGDQEGLKKQDCSTRPDCFSNSKLQSFQQNLVGPIAIQIQSLSYLLVFLWTPLCFWATGSYQRPQFSQSPGRWKTQSKSKGWNRSHSLGKEDNSALKEHLCSLRIACGILYPGVPFLKMKKQ